MENRPQTEGKRPRPHYETKRFRILAYITIAILVLIIGSTVIRQFALLEELRNAPWPDIGPLPVSVVEVTVGPDQVNGADVTPDPMATPYIKPIPVMIAFPAFGIESRIHPVGVTPEGNIATVDSAGDSAWFEPYPAPGETGNAIINGHVSYGGKRGSFAVLKELSVGDQVTVTFEDGHTRYFEVYRNETFLLETFPEDYLESYGEDRLTLITCKGDFDRAIGTSRSRVVVLCRPV